MKVRLELELNMATGSYDVRFHNLTDPGKEIDLGRFTKLVVRVLENVVNRSIKAPEPTLARRQDMN